jgi:hypothetical protein
MKEFLAIVNNYKEAKALSLISQQLSMTNIKNISACPEVGTDLKQPRKIARLPATISWFFLFFCYKLISSFVRGEGL